MLKNILNTILLIIIRILIFLIPIMFIIQTLTKEETTNALLDGLINTMFEHMEYETPDEKIIEEYFNQEDLKEYYKHFIEAYIKSYTSNGEVPNLNNEEFQQIINDAEIKYEQETGTKLDTTEIYKNIDESNQKIQQNTIMPESVKKVISYKVKTKDIILTIFIIIILLLVLYYLNKDLNSIVIFLSKIFLSKTIFLILFTIFIRYINKISEHFKDFVNLMTKTTDRLAVGFLTITIALYIIRIILSKRKEMPAELPPQETPTNEPIQITNI